MWEAIKEVLTSSNAVGVLLILGFIIIVLIIVAIAYGEDNPMYYFHYVAFGKSEGRKGAL